MSAEVRQYCSLFTDLPANAGGKNFLDTLNPDSLKAVTAVVEPSLAAAKPDQKFQFDRHGYFVPTARTMAWARRWCSTGYGVEGLLGSNGFEEKKRRVVNAPFLF